MNVKVELEWFPHIYRLPKKTPMSQKCILKHQDTIKKWYQKIWIQNQFYDYKIDDISLDFLEEKNKILIIAGFKLKTKRGIDLSLFSNPPTDSNDDNLNIKNIGNLAVDSNGINNVLIDPLN